MALVLNVIRCPDSVMPEMTRRLTGESLRIGRDSAHADWVLPDPGKHLSRTHCIVQFIENAWQITDPSSNGTFLNRETEAIGATVRPLHDGDRLRLKPYYEIEVRIEAVSPPRRTGEDWSPFDEHALRPMQGSTSFAVHTDRSPALSDNLRPEAPGPPRPGTLITPANAAPASQTEDDEWKRVFASLGDLGPQAAGGCVEPEDEVAKPAQLSLVQAEALSMAPGRQVSAASHPGQENLTQSPLLTAFMEGAGLPNLVPQDPVAAMRDAGLAFRAFVIGLRELLIVRAATKSALRLDQTVIRSGGNNPLKFSAGDEDALLALLGVGRRVDMTPPAAVSEALLDLRHHEQATMPALQAALRDMLDGLKPEAFKAAADTVGGVALASQRGARAFKLFEAAYDKLLEDLTDEFDSVFGRRFAEAYQALTDDLQRRGGQR